MRAPLSAQEAPAAGSLPPRPHPAKKYKQPPQAKGRLFAFFRKPFQSRIHGES